MTLKVTPATIAVTAENDSKAFDTADPDSFAYTVNTHAVAGEAEAFDGALAREAGEAVGHYDIQQGTLALKDNGAFLASNYTLSFTEGDFEIYDNDTMSLTANGYEDVYDGGTHAATASASVAGAKVEWSQDGEVW